MNSASPSADSLHISLNVILEIVPPVLCRQIRIREQNLPYAIGVLHRDRLALSGLTCVVIEFGEPQDVAGDLDEIGLSVLDRNR